MFLREILKGLEYKASDRAEGVDIRRMTDDSKSVRAGDLFVAFRGYTIDGYQFIPEAISSGAGFIAAEKNFDAPDNVVKIIIDDTRASFPIMANNFYGGASTTLKMIGVTGTNGKTTVTYIVENILKKAGAPCGVIGTINYRIGSKAIPAKNTTPGPLELQSTLADMVKSGAKYAVMEVSSHALDQRRVEGVGFDAAIFTNITPEHLDYHGTIDEYFRAKIKIFDNLKAGGIAILNIDDARVASLSGSFKERVITYGIIGKPDVRANNVELSIDGTKFEMAMAGRNFKISTRLIGRHNVSNILAAAAASTAIGINDEAILAGIETVSGVPGRIEPVECGQPFKVLVDFAHTRDALYNVLNLLREVTKEKIITVFGCGGNRDRSKRPLMGKVACELSDHVVITSDNPRMEDPAVIIEEIVSGVKEKFSNYNIEADRRKAIEKALRLADENSIVVIAGKGHEDYQIIGGSILPFDDRVVARQILKAIGNQ